MRGGRVESTADLRADQVEDVRQAWVMGVVSEHDSGSEATLTRGTSTLTLPHTTATHKQIFVLPVPAAQLTPGEYAVTFRLEDPRDGSDARYRIKNPLLCLLAAEED